VNLVFDFIAVSVTSVVGRTSWRTAQNIGKSLGWLAYCVSPRKRKQTRTNLRGAGVDALGTGCRKAWMHMGQSVLETLWLTSQPSDRVLAQVTIEGLDVLDDAGKDGRGVLLVAGHIANWELVAMAAGRVSAPVAVVAEPMKTSRLERRVVAFRKRCGVRTLMRGQQGTSIVAARWMYRGGVLGCMMDRSRFGHLMTIPFLQQTTRIPVGPAELAARAGAAVVLGSATRLQDGSIRSRFRRLSQAEGREPQEMARMIGQALEEEVLAIPEQWFWITRRKPTGGNIDPEPAPR